MMKQPMSHDMPKELEQIVQSIYGSDFSEHTLHLMDNYIQHTQWKNKSYSIQSTGACRPLRCR